MKKKKSLEHKYISKRYGKILHIFDFVFRQNYYYINAIGKDDYSKIVKKQLKIDYKFNKDEKNGGFSIYEQYGHEVCFIWTKGKRYDNVCHECFHAIRYMLEQRGLTINKDTDEIFAYTLQWLVDEIMKFG